ncbi:MAG TPA: putative toxin-antitoxin system toxin component, PIN family [Longimicrobiales bacterium]|nr:putative toxin-antitoxin system toxin component, PIN family [Longimicrobiales bacterium]
MRVVLDTNVLVSGTLKSTGVPGRVLSLIYDARIRPVVDARILAEYRAVLARPRLKIPAAVGTELLRRFAEVAEHVTVTAAAVSRLDRVALKDPNDRPFMEVAASVAAFAIVTGNTRHLPRAALAPVRVLTPRHLLDEFGSE